MTVFTGEFKERYDDLKVKYEAEILEASDNWHEAIQERRNAKAELQRAALPKAIVAAERRFEFLQEEVWRLKKILNAKKLEWAQEISTLRADVKGSNAFWKKREEEDRLEREERRLKAEGLRRQKIGRWHDGH